VLTWAAFAVPAAGAVVALLATVAIAINGSTDREIIGGLTGWAVASLGFLALVVGSGLFALATLRARSLPRAASALLLAGAVVTVPALGGLSGGLVPDAMVQVLIVTTMLLFPAGWVALGVSALRVDRAGATFEGAIS
jgi:hypothetical protein